MDKKKVIELIDDAIYQLDPFGMDIDNYEDQCKNATKILYSVQDELKKSDWIPVEDELPPYYKDVFVKSERTTNIIQTYRDDFDEDDGMFHPFRDKNNFVLNGGICGRISHWCKIDKLEV